MGDAAGDALLAFEKGNEEFVKENWSVALSLFSRACELDPSKVEYILHKAAALQKTGQIDASIQACDEAMKLEPANGKPYLRKGMALVGKGDLASAKQVLEAGQGVDPANKSFAVWLKKCGAEPSAPAAPANGELGKHDEALAAIFKAHGEQGYSMLETVFDYLKRNSNFFAMPGGMAVEMVNKLAAGSAAAAGGQPAVAAPQAQAPAPSAGPGEQIELPIAVSSSAKSALAKAKEAREKALAEGAGTESGIKVGTQCKNNSCTNTYQDESSLSQNCVYHPGAPVFHEGYKFWSCCKKKKTTEFSEFLSFVGCTQGTCTFVEDPTKRKAALCRYDYYQQGKNVYVSVYAKKVDPEQCTIKLSATRLSLTLVFDFVNSFTLDVELSGRVDPRASKVEILAPKVEITLVKADGSGWSELGNLISKEIDDGQ